MVKNFSFILLSLLFNVVFAQPEKIWEKEGLFIDFQVDELGNIYVINAKNELLKLSSDGNEMAKFSSNTYGRISHMDVSNPFKLLLYYSPIYTLVSLDNKLSLLQETRLNLGKLGRIKAVCTSQNGGYWVYDQASSTLYQVNNDFNTIAYASEKLFPVPKSMQLYEEGNQLFAYDDSQGIVYAYDALGTFKKKIQVQKGYNIHFGKEEIQQLQSNSIYIYNHKSLLMDTIRVDIPEIVDAIQYKKSILVLTSKGLSLWAFK